PYLYIPSRLLTDRLARTLVGTGSGLGVPAANRKTTTMTQTTIATQIHETLDVHVDHAAQVTFRGVLGDVYTQLITLLLAQIADLGAGLNASGGTDLLCLGLTDTIDLGQRDNSMLVIRDVDACNTGHPNLLRLTAT